MPNKEKVKLSGVAELEAAKREAMRIRFRRVLGETVSAHAIKSARKNIASCVRSMKNEMRGKDA
jgi:ribosomal protein L29